MKTRRAATSNDPPDESTSNVEPGGSPAAASGADDDANAGESSEQAAQEFYAYPIPDEYADRQGVELLMEACSLYGINPDKNAEPVQLLEWKFYKGDVRKRVPDRIVLVTAGGLKLAHPADEDTVDRLRRTFRLYRERKNKDGSVEIDTLPMPDDLTLPSTTLHGQVEAKDHVYQRGYLREGGAKEASVRAARRRAQLPG